MERRNKLDITCIWGSHKTCVQIYSHTTVNNLPLLVSPVCLVSSFVDLFPLLTRFSTRHGNFEFSVRIFIFCGSTLQTTERLSLQFPTPIDSFESNFEILLINRHCTSEYPLSAIFKFSSSCSSFDNSRSFLYHMSFVLG